MIMKLSKNSGATLAVVAASLLLGGLAGTTVVKAADAAQVHCVGVNACKGNSSCKTANNACKGQNSCKGLGYVSMSSEQCKQIGGKEG
jgi:hypothetical protein